MATIEDQLEAMRQLQKNWDGYAAERPAAHVIEAAREFVRLIQVVLKTRTAARETLRVSPTRIGGILVEWDEGDLQHEVEIDPDQSFSFLHFNEVTGHTETRKLAPRANAVVPSGVLRELCELLPP